MTARLFGLLLAAGLSDRRRYTMHKANAKKVGTPFKLTFEEWLTWWLATGHYHERGRRRGQYVMARKGDKGAYELGNIECLQAQENSIAAHLGKTRSAATRANMRRAFAKKRTDELNAILRRIEENP